VPKVLPLGTLHKVLQNLLAEEVPIRDMRTILDVMAEHAPMVKDATELTSLTRVALSRAIVQQLFPEDAQLQVIGLDASLEQVLQQALGSQGGIEPGLADRLLQETQAAVERQEQLGVAPVLVVPHGLRVLLARFLRRSIARLHVLSQAEIPETRHIRVTATLGGPV